MAAMASCGVRLSPATAAAFPATDSASSSSSSSSSSFLASSFRGLPTARHGSLQKAAARLGAAPLGRHVARRQPGVVCGLADFVGGDLLGFDLGRWCEELENYGSLGFYAPPEGGAEGRYATVLKEKGYRLMNISARGLGDPEAYLTKVHGVRPPHLGKQAVARWYLPPEVDYRLSTLHKDDKGLVLWIGEAKVLAKNELQFLAILPAIRPNVKVVCEMGGARKLNWKPLKEICGLPIPKVTLTPAEVPVPAEKVPVSAE